MKVGEMEKKYLSLMQVANKLNFSYNTIYGWIKSGKLKSYSFNGCFRILEEDLNEFIKESQGVNVKIAVK
ncbi:hypothetical protein ES704_03787 [subsurface metagenome]|jgi:excisionase family DNA binding protein